METIKPGNNGLDLTILSVSFHSQPYLELNYALSQHLNPPGEIPWIVVQNTPPPGEPFQSHGSLTVIDGVVYDTERYRAGSDHHARALNEGIRRVRTRYALVLDPDFYIVRRGWGTDILRYMQAKQLAALGVTWHPRWWRKYRKFPAPHCLFLDLSQIPPESCDFSPGVHKYLAPASPKAGAASDGGLPGRVRRRLSYELNNLRSSPLLQSDLRRVDDPYKKQYHTLGDELDIAVHRARYVNALPDTGYLLNKKLQELNLTFEFIPVVFRPERDYRMISYMPGLQRLVDLFVGPDLALIPRQAGYYVRDGFQETGYPDTRSFDCEEFMWEGEPFGFHVRSHPRGRMTMSLEHEQIASLIKTLTGFVPSSSS